LAGRGDLLRFGPALARAVIVLAACTLVAELSWRFLESPLLESKPSIPPAAVESVRCES
jgi:peptidoglycan/LPS O-acetylase OafA/YrhL